MASGRSRLASASWPILPRKPKEEELFAAVTAARVGDLIEDARGRDTIRSYFSALDRRESCSFRRESKPGAALCAGDAA